MLPIVQVRRHALLLQVSIIRRTVRVHGRLDSSSRRARLARCARASISLLHFTPAFHIAVDGAQTTGRSLISTVVEVGFAVVVLAANFLSGTGISKI